METKMKSYIRCSGIIVIILSVLIAAANSQSEQKPRLGINFYSICDWNRDIPFVDIMRSARPWFPQREDKWDTGSKLDLDEDGYVKALPAGEWVSTLMFTDIEGRHPTGDFVFLYEGDGIFEWDGLAKLKSSEPGRQVVEISGSGGTHARLMIKSIKSENYPRNMRFIRPGYEEKYLENPYATDFLERWGGVDTIRFMDWMRINATRQSAWEDRSRTSHFSFKDIGTPLELMIDLCNRTNSNAWFSLPHLADDDYIRKFAEMVKEKLNPELLVYFEFSNEVWNNMFSQNKWANEQGMALGLAERPWEAGWLFYSKQCARMFDIIEEIFSGDTRNRCRLVVSSQAANSYITRKIIESNNIAGRADVLSIGPYITFNIGVEPRKELPGAAEAAEWSLDKLFEFLNENSLKRSFEWIDQHAEIAKKHRLELVAYEGGQHLSTLGEAQNNNKLVELMASANRDPRMGELYKRYFEHWHNAGGSLFCHWNATSQYGRYGYWGLLEWRDQDTETSPKYQALKKWSGILP